MRTFHSTPLQYSTSKRVTSLIPLKNSICSKTPLHRIHSAVIRSVTWKIFSNDFCDQKIARENCVKICPCSVTYLRVWPWKFLNLNVWPKNEKKNQTRVTNKRTDTLKNCSRSKLSRGIVLILYTVYLSRSMTNQENDMCAQRRIRSAWASAQSDQSLRCPPEESLSP